MFILLQKKKKKNSNFGKFFIRAKLTSFLDIFIAYVCRYLKARSTYVHLIICEWLKQKSYFLYYPAFINLNAVLYEYYLRWIRASKKIHFLISFKFWKIVVAAF